MRNFVIALIAFCAILLLACSVPSDAHCPSDAEVRWFNTLDSMYGEVNDALDELESLLRRATITDSLWDDPAWQTQYMDAIRVFSVSASDLRALKPPMGAGEIQANNVQTATQLDNMYRHGLEILENPYSPVGFNASQSALDRVQSLTGDRIRLIETYCE